MVSKLVLFEPQKICSLIKETEEVGNKIKWIFLINKVLSRPYSAKEKMKKKLKIQFVVASREKYEIC